MTKRRVKTGSGEDYIYRFYDFNAKVNYQLNKTDQLYLSFYNGFDRFTYKEWQNNDGREVSTAVGNNWGNATGTLRYSKMISPRLFARATMIYSRYTSEFKNDYLDIIPDGDEKKVYRYTNAGVRDIGGKAQLDYFPAGWLDLKLGMEATRHTFSPFVTESNYRHFAADRQSDPIAATRLDGFADADFTLTKQLKLNAGIRYSRYRVEGRSFQNPEPRLGISWEIARKWTLKGGASLMNQYLHLLTNNGYGFGYDAWVPSTRKVPPSRARQVSMGITKVLPAPGIEISLEVYRKSMRNLVDYPEGTNFTGLLADSWDDIVLKEGRGRAKGLELMLSRKSGRLNGHAAYTWSKSDLQFNEINAGRWYSMKYDRRHQVSVVAGYPVSRKWVLNGAFVYQTGHAVTLPEAALLSMISDQSRFVYNERHNGRMPAFHRLDLGVIRRGSIWKDRKTRLGLGVYNVYNRANPLYLDFRIRHDRQTGQRSLAVKQYSLFPVLPYITYSIQF